MSSKFISLICIPFMFQVGMGIIPLQYKAGDTAESLGLTGTEQFSVNLPEELKPRQNIMVRTIYNTEGKFNYTGFQNVLDEKTLS